jgi:hypothetical protein
MYVPVSAANEIACCMLQHRFAVAQPATCNSCLQHGFHLAVSMKAIRIHEYGGVGTLKLEEVPLISITDDEVLVRVHDAGVNPVDWKIRQASIVIESQTYLKEDR